MSVSLSSTDLDAIRQLLKIVTDNNLSELTLSLRDGVSITVRTAQPEAVAYAPAPTALAPYVAQQQVPVRKAQISAPAIAANRISVVSPMVGIFYSSASPGEAAFVKIGDTIKIGQTIGLIEAMKVFSEIPSEVSGQVVELLIESGTLVQLGQPLMYLEPL